MAKKRRGSVDEGLFSRTEPEKAPASQQTPQPMPEEETIPIKVTYYLPEDLAMRVDLVQFQLKRITGLRGHDVSKSAIARAALEMAFDELEEKGEGSEFARRLSEQ